MLCPYFMSYLAVVVALTMALTDRIISGGPSVTSVYLLHLVTNVLQDVDVQPLDVLVPPMLVPIFATVPVFHLLWMH